MLLTACPHCGHNLVKERTLKGGPFLYVPGDGLYVFGRRMRGIKTHIIIGAIMTAKGRSLSSETIADISECTGVDSVKVMLHRFREECKEIGVHDPIAASWGRGYRWVGDTIKVIEQHADELN